jgi:hypothetical protein
VLLFRDLALNWNVDIAQDLETYLTELELIHISFDGGETKMNFAEAALLIQGSAAHFYTDQLIGVHINRTLTAY